MISFKDTPSFAASFRSKIISHETHESTHTQNLNNITLTEKWAINKRRFGKMIPGTQMELFKFQHV